MTRQSEIDALIEDAELNAAKGWETDFVASIRDQFDAEPNKQFSERQLDKLKAIAGGTNSTRHQRF